MTAARLESVEVWVAPFGKVMYFSESISDSMNNSSTSNPSISQPKTAARCDA
jgi:hypothetical protein